MINFWPPLIGGIIGGGLGFFVAEIVRRQIRHHTRIEGDRDEELRLVSGAIDNLRSLAIDYWKRDRIADDDALLEAAIIGRSACPLSDNLGCLT